MSFEAAGEDPLQEFRENVAEFAQSVIAPHAEEVDKSNDFPKSVNLWKEMGDFGLLGERANAQMPIIDN
jgi:isovaleryl-CoA dehydrogenase